MGGRPEEGRERERENPSRLYAEYGAQLGAQSQNPEIMA